MTTNSSFLLFLGLCSLFFFACEGDDDTSNICNNPAKTQKIYFEGIFLTDENGQSLGGEDEEDWRTDDIWTEQELSLFEYNTASVCAIDSMQKVYPPFPNSNNGVFNMQFYNNAAVADLSLRFVDEDFQVRSTHEFNQLNQGINTFSFNFQDLNFNDTIRVYYKIIQADCEFRGHGDILIKP